MKDLTNNAYFTYSYKKQEEKNMDMSIDVTNLPLFVRNSQTGDKVFFRKDREAHWIKNPDALKALGGDFSKVETLDNETFKGLSTIVEPIDMSNYKKYVKEEDTSREEVILDKFEENPVISLEKAPDIIEEKGFTSIIIPAFFLDYSVFHYTGNCIGSIREHTNLPYEIILVINGMTHIKFDNLEQTNADKVVQNEVNMGYAQAVNKGIRISKGEYIAIINNDSQVFDNWLPDMQESLNYLDLVMATPMYGRPFSRAVESKKLREKTLDRPIQDTFSDFRDFSCVLTRKSLFKEIGTMNESFFCYKEDLDLFNRMIEKGKKFSSTKRVNTHHIIGATSMNLTPDQLHKKEGEEIYKELWKK